MQFLLQGEVPPRRQQPLDQSVGGGEVDGMPPLDQFQADGANQMGLSPPRQAKGQQVLGAFDEPALAEGGKVPARVPSTAKDGPKIRAAPAPCLRAPPRPKNSRLLRNLISQLRQVPRLDAPGDHEDHHDEQGGGDHEEARATGRDDAETGRHPDRGG